MKKVSQIPMPWELAGADPKTPVLLALSGGADSRFLLDRLAKGSRRYGFSLLLAHVNHGIRGANADRDAEFCRALAEQYDLPIEVFSADVPALAKAHGRGIEEEAREVRYAFFEKLMREKSIPLLATAHQADDLLETMLFRIARGTGTAGLCSILPARPFANGSVTRPLLGLSAAEIRKACRAEGLDFTEDETNADPTYARNLIRAQVIPALEKLYAAPQKQAAKLAERVRLDEDYFAGQVKAVWQEEFRGGLPCAFLAALHPALRTRVLTRFLAENGVTADSAMLERACGLIDGRNGRKIPLLGIIYLFKRQGNLIVEEKTASGPTYRVPLREGKNELPGGMTVTVGEGKKIAPLPESTGMTAWSLRFPDLSAALQAGYFWRPKREGDMILRGGHHKQLRKIWRESGVPEELRSRLPVLCCKGGIVWAPFCGFADEIKK